MTLFSEKPEHVSILYTCGTLEVKGSHLGNATICGITEKNVVEAFIKLSAMYYNFDILCTMDVLSCPTTKSIDSHSETTMTTGPGIGSIRC